MTSKRLHNIIKNIRYKDWTFDIQVRKDCFLLQVRFYAEDSETKRWEVQHCRKWFISTHACKAEVVRTAFKAVLAAEQHEVNENFRYRGVPIHSPHLNPDKLADIFLSEDTPFNRRRKQK